MKKILFLTPNLCSGGAERQMVTVACNLREKDYDVTVYCYDKDNFYEDILLSHSVKVVWELELYNYWKRILNVRKFVRNGSYDVVISFMPTCNLLNNIAGLGGKKWIIITGERSSRDSTFLTTRNKISNFLQRSTDFIVCNSKNAQNKWLKHYPHYQSKLKVIYNTVKLGVVHSEYIPRRDCKLHIIVAATYQYLKNPIGLIEALKLCSEEELSCFVIDWYGRTEIARGDTRAYDETVGLVKENNLQQSLVLHHNSKDIANLQHQADAVMLLSKFEGLPNVICEGMMLSKPIIMTRCSDYSTLVNEDNGFLCDWDNPLSIKEAIISMYRLSVSDLKEYGAKSHVRALKLFSEDVVISEWEKLING